MEYRTVDTGLGPQLIAGYKPTVAHPTVIVRSSRVCYAQCLYKLSVLYNDDCGHLYSLVINRGRQLSLWVIHGRYRREPSLPGSVGGTPDGSMSSIYPEDGHTRLRIEGTPNGF